MPPDRHRQHRRRIARLYLTLIFLGLAVADALLAYYTFHPLNPWPLLRSQVIGGALASVFLLAGIWRRQGWARYLMIFLLWYIVTVFTLVLLYVANRPDRSEPRTAVAAAVALVIYIAANTLLIRSRKIRYLCEPASSGD